jgi:hypothetical protein
MSYYQWLCLKRAAKIFGMCFAIGLLALIPAGAVIAIIVVAATSLVLV